MSEERSRVAKLVAIAAGVVSVAGGLVKVFLFAANPYDPPANYALFLLGESWWEFTTVLAVTGAFLVAQRLWILIRNAQYATTQPWRESLARPANLVAATAIVLLSLNLVWPTWYFIKARKYFWTALPELAHSQASITQVNMLAREGRIRTARARAELAKTLVRSAALRDQLQRHIGELEVLIKRSEALSVADKTNNWNPVTQRTEYFELAEALRIDAENYAAAERLRELLVRVEKFLEIDRAEICGSGGRLDRFRGYATSYLEAQVHWSWSETEYPCNRVMDKVRIGWAVDEVTAVVARSDRTKISLSASANAEEIDSPTPSFPSILGTSN